MNEPQGLAWAYSLPIAVLTRLEVGNALSNLLALGRFVQGIGFGSMIVRGKGGSTHRQYCDYLERSDLDHIKLA